VHGGGGARTRFICGYVACDRRVCRPMIGALPRMLRVRLGDRPSASWMARTLQHAAEESRAPRAGSDAVLTKLSELLFVEALRAYLETVPEQERSWLAGLRDPHVSRVLGLMHAEPARQWTVNDLGREAGLSRSALGERFALLIGEPPMQYLTRWRLALGARALAIPSSARVSQCCTVASTIRGRSPSWPRPSASRERPSSIDSPSTCPSRRWRT